MSSSEEQKPSRSGLGWFPKLILWAAVIGFGYVYLSSVDREGGGTSASAMLDSIAKLSPVPLSSLPGFSDKEEPAAESTAVAQADEASKTEAATKPVAQTESAAFTRALVSDKPETTTAKPVELSEAPKPATQPPVSYAAAALKTPAPAAPAPSAPVEPPASAPVTAAPTTTPAPIASRPMPAPTASPPEPAMPAPSEQAPMARMPANEWAVMRDQQRAEMMAQYEAMRREADERMRRYWAQMREAMPMPTVPYGHPGYAPGYMPGYAPGYAPGVYGPPVR